LILEAKADFMSENRFGVLFLVEMRKPDRSKASDIFSMGQS